MVYPPGALPTDATNATTSTDTHPGRHNSMAAAVNDVVAELGANPSGAAATVEARLDAADVLRYEANLWAGAGFVFANAPADGTEQTSTANKFRTRAYVDARRASHFRTYHVLESAVAANGARFEFSTDNGTSWATLLDNGAGNFTLLSPWTAVPAAAKVVNLLIRLVVYGDGVADPVGGRAQVIFGAP